MLKELIEKTRSSRRFYQNEPLDTATLLELIDLARLAGSARNIQPLKYSIINDRKACEIIFSHLGWAGYLNDWPGPVEGERPSAYIICLLDTTIANEADCDLGIATQNILLGATERGLGGCRIASISPKLHNASGLPEHLKILLILALGKPKEHVVVDAVSTDGDCRYWRDNEAVHHVPKRTLEEIIIKAEL
jgi:nitroreductase